jgi:hypothetical protein
MGTTSVNSETKKIAYAATGSGPLLQRDYVGVIEGSDWTPEILTEEVRKHFADFCPKETATFQCPGTAGEALSVNTELRIQISGILPCQVRVVHCDGRSLTLRTLDGHPEAGRITFGAGDDEQGRLTFRIRSRARAGGLLHYLGFLLMGRSMQARCWIRFIGRVAEAGGGRLVGPVRVSTETVEEEPADCGEPHLPTFCCDELLNNGRVES